MSTIEVLERLAHMAFALALLFGLAQFTRFAIDSPPAAAGPSVVSAAPPHDTALDPAPAALDVSLTTACNR